jgi:hypothetical protein
MGFLKVQKSAEECGNKELVRNNGVASGGMSAPEIAGAGWEG